MNEDMEVNDIIEKYGKRFLLTLVAICVVGIIMVLSSSYMYAKEVYDDSLYFFIRQSLYLGLGSLVAFSVSKTRYTFWMKYSYMIHFFITILLFLTLIPSLGVTAKGASRWIGAWGMTFQPSELIKYTSVIASIHYFDFFMQMTNRQRVQRGVYLLLPMVILLIQPDFGSFAILICSMVFACFLGSFPRKYFYASIPAGALIIVGILFSQPYRVERLFTFLNPWENPRGSGFQIIQSLYGFANGSWIGQGLGNSNEKLFYLPEAHNDFIFSVIGEEVGFMGVMVVAILFVLLIYFGFQIAAKATERMGLLLVTAIVFLIGLQAFLNMGVVLGLLPTKGLNLPFISYGGSSIVANLFGVGLVFSVLNHEKEKERTTSFHSHHDPTHRFHRREAGSSLYSRSSMSDI